MQKITKSLDLEVVAARAAFRDFVECAREEIEGMESGRIPRRDFPGVRSIEVLNAHYMVLVAGYNISLNYSPAGEFTTLENFYNSNERFPEMYEVDEVLLSTDSLAEEKIQRPQRWKLWRLTNLKNDESVLLVTVGEAADELAHNVEITPDFQLELLGPVPYFLPPGVWDELVAGDSEPAKLIWGLLKCLTVRL